MTRDGTGWGVAKGAKCIGSTRGAFRYIIAFPSEIRVNIGPRRNSICFSISHGPLLFGSVKEPKIVNAVIFRTGATVADMARNANPNEQRHTAKQDRDREYRA